MIPAINVVMLFFAYLIGSFPSAVWIGKFFYGVDVREFGSGNAGATNTFRILGKKAGIPVLVIDILKGWFAVNCSLFSAYDFGSEQFVNFQLMLGVAALVGHIFPVFSSFKGGKGIATLLGVVFAIHPKAAMISVLIFMVIFLISNYVSLGSISAAVAFPIIIIIVYHARVPSLIIFSLVIAILVLITHQKNIERLIRKEEAKTRLNLRKKSSVLKKN